MKKLLNIIILTFSVSIVFCQPIQFIEYYGGVCPDFGLSLDKTDDGGYILLGHTENFGALYQDVFLLKIDSIGNLEWHKLFGGANLDFGQSIQKTHDNGFILCGFTNSYGAGAYDIYIVKTDSLGNFQWQKTYGGTNNDYGYCIKQTSDRGFIICGSTESYGSGGTDAILIKTDSLGNQQWSKYYGGVNNDGAYSLDITADSAYVLAGYTYNFGASAVDAMIIKTDSVGNQEWLEIYGGSANDRALFIKQNYDGGFCFAGYTSSYGSGADDMYFVRTDSSGNLVYFNTYGGSLDERAFSLDFTSDKGFILTGQTNSFGNGNSDLYVVKADSLGNMIWHNFFGGSENDQGFTIKATNDGGYIAIGNTWSFNIIWAHVYVVKMDSTGYATSINFMPNKKKQIKVYPNPANDKITFERYGENSECIISIYDLKGKLFLQKTYTNNINDVIISSIPHGLYIMRIESGNTIEYVKFIKQ